MRARSVVLVALGAVALALLVAYAALRGALGVYVPRFDGWEYTVIALLVAIALGVFALARRKRISLVGIHLQRRDPVVDPGFARDAGTAAPKPRRLWRKRT